MIKNMLAGLAAVSLAATPVAAQENAARDAAPVESSEKFLGENGGLFALILVVGIIVAVGIITSDDNEVDRPTSP